MAPAEDATAVVGEWNRGRIVCKGTIIQHWLNGKKIVDFDYTDEQWKFNVDLLNARGGDLRKRGARLSLQDHGDPVWYRNIQLRSVGPDEDIHHSTVQPEKISEDVLEKERAKLEGILQRRAQQKQRQQERKPPPQ